MLLVGGGFFGILIAFAIVGSLVFILKSILKMFGLKTEPDPINIDNINDPKRLCDLLIEVNTELRVERLNSNSNKLEELAVNHDKLYKKAIDLALVSGNFEMISALVYLKSLVDKPTENEVEIYEKILAEFKRVYNETLPLDSQYSIYLKIIHVYGYYLNSIGNTDKAREMLALSSIDKAKVKDGKIDIRAMYPFQ